MQRTGYPEGRTRAEEEGPVKVGGVVCARCGTVPLPPSDPTSPITADSDRAKHEYWCPRCQNLCGVRQVKDDETEAEEE
jgi:hypothetical protein